MTRAQLAAFKVRLDELAAEIHASLAEADPTAESIAPDKAIGRLTRMEAIQAQSMSDEGRRRARLRLDRIARALQRIEDGTYGTCTRCGSEIPAGRLEYMPESILCVTCAGRR